MNLKNIFAVVAISAATAVLSVWGFSKFQERQFAGMQESGNCLLIMQAFLVIKMHPMQWLILRRLQPVLLPQ